MKKLVLFFAVLAALTFCRVSVHAQDTDKMDNGQLITLIQSVMNKLQSEETSPEKDPEPAAKPTEIPTAIPTDVPEIKPVRTFRIYENKKLISDRIPDQYFVRKDSGKGEEETGDSGKFPGPDSCLPGQSYDCYIDYLTGQYTCSCGWG